MFKTISLYVAVVSVMLFTSCITNTRRPDDENGRSAIRTLSELESKLSQLDRRVEILTARSEGIEGDVDKLTELIRVYVDTVRAMRAELEEYRSRTKADES